MADRQSAEESKNISQFSTDVADRQSAEESKNIQHNS